MTDIDTSQPTRIYKSHRDALISVAVAGAFVAVSIFMVTNDGTGMWDRRGRSGGWIGLLFFGPLLIWWLGVLVRPRLAPVTMDAGGITDFRVNRGIIPWAEVTNVARRGQVVSLTLRRGFAKTFRQSLQARLAKRFLRKGGPTHVYILPFGLGITTTELLDLVTAYWSAARAA